MEKEVYLFFEEFIDPEQPILLGYSGGPDSACLLQLLLRWKKIPLHLVHVDHGWRKESEQERVAIQELAQKLALPLHWTTLDPRAMQGNLEAECREARLKFFQKVASEVEAQGCLLAHHADDQAETVFKRLLEGANLVNLSAMAPIYTIDRLRLMRPLLTIKKRELLSWLERHGITYFQDATNQDVRFLRAKMRQEIFPYLRTSFGKEFEDNLTHIAQEAYDLRLYLDEKIQSYLEKASTSNWGTSLCSLPTTQVETKHLLQQVAKREGLIFSRDQIEKASHLLLTKAADKEIILQGRSIIFDRGRAFFCKAEIPDVEGSITLSLGKAQFGNWSVCTTPYEAHFKLQNHFSDVWNGTLCTALPAGSYTLCRSNPRDRRLLPSGNTKEYRHFITEKKIPHFLTTKVPVIMQAGQIVEDFLSATPPPSKQPDFVIYLCTRCMMRSSSWRH